jgi:hypothetical protein
MTTAPILTPELRKELEKRYHESLSVTIRAFVVWTNHLNNTRIEWFKSVADAYDFRWDMITSDLGYETEDFLIVNTFKEFESEGD